MRFAASSGLAHGVVTSENAAPTPKTATWNLPCCEYGIQRFRLQRGASEPRPAHTLPGHSFARVVLDLECHAFAPAMGTERDVESSPSQPARGAVLGRALGPAVFLIVMLAPTGSLTGPAKTVAAGGLWMAAWWVTEAAPIAVTALSILTAVGACGKRLVWGFLIATVALSMWLSNTATATLLMPIMAALAMVFQVPPYLLMLPAIVSCSCGFMLPVATPPNAIVIGPGHITPRVLLREGLRLNLISSLVITLPLLTLGRCVLPI